MTCTGVVCLHLTAFYVINFCSAVDMYLKVLGMLGVCVGKQITLVMQWCWIHGVSANVNTNVLTHNWNYDFFYIFGYVTIWF